MIAVVDARLSFNQRVVWHNNKLVADVEIRISADVTVNLRALRVEDALQLVADAFAYDKADNCPICAIDEHVVDQAEKSSAARQHFPSANAGQEGQFFELSKFSNRRPPTRLRLSPERIHS